MTTGKTQENTPFLKQFFIVLFEYALTHTGVHTQHVSVQTYVRTCMQIISLFVRGLLGGKAQLRVRVMCETAKVNYQLIVILLTSLSSAL